MGKKLTLKDGFRLAQCCRPGTADSITGFLKPESGLITIHKIGCGNLKSIQPERLLMLEWDEALSKETKPEQSENPVFSKLDDVDFKILAHHAKMGVDYAAVVAKSIKVDRATVFERHKKLRDLKLLARVQPKMIRYRKNIVDNKWIKHRNHTYYEITEKGSWILSSNKG